MEESGEVFAVAFLADGQATVTSEPGDGPFDLPPVSAEPIVPVDPASGDARDDALGAQPPTVDVVVVALVGAESSGPTAARTTPGLHRRDRADHRLQQGAVVGIRSGNVDDQRDSVRIG